MADVFISYHRSEGTSALVRRIAAELENMGISCWYDTKDPNPGYFVQTIEQEILCCKVFLLIWDNSANNSEWCLTETYTAFEGANRPIRIPFQIGTFIKDNDMKFYMKRCQIFFGGNSPEKANIEKLVIKIAALFDKKPTKIIKSGSCGDNVTYTLDENGVLTISGKGKINDMRETDDTPWQNENELIQTVRIQKGVTEIGRATFYGCSSLTSVTIPDSVTKIRDGAFYNCSNLVSVTIPNSVTSVGDWTFAYCSSLASVTIPDSVTQIGSWSFYKCSSLRSVTISDSVTSIGAWAFTDCDSLTGVSVSATVEIDDDAFPETTKVIRRP